MNSFGENSQQYFNTEFPYYQVYWNYPTDYYPNFTVLVPRNEYGKENLTNQYYCTELLKNVTNNQFVKETKQNNRSEKEEKNNSEAKKLNTDQFQEQIVDPVGQKCPSNQRLLPDSLQKRSWTKIQEDKLVELVILFGQHWKQISQHFPDRKPKQIRQRYLNYLRPCINHGKWTKEEDEKLQTMVSIYGHSWKIIEKKFKNRSQNQVKNRYYGHIKKIIELKTNSYAVKSNEKLSK